MTPDDYCQEKAAASGSSFYYSFLFLPPERRRAITALYAFCREIDDIVDECHDPQVAAPGSLEFGSAQIIRRLEATPGTGFAYAAGSDHRRDGQAVGC